MPQRRRRLPAVWRGDLARGAAGGEERVSLSLTAEAAGGKLDPGRWEGKRETGSGEAAALKATLGQAWFLWSGVQVAKPGGRQRPLKQCQCSTGKCVRSGGLEKCYVKQFGVSRR